MRLRMALTASRSPSCSMRLRMALTASRWPSCSMRLRMALTASRSSSSSNSATAASRRGPLPTCTICVSRATTSARMMRARAPTAVLCASVTPPDKLCPSAAPMLSFRPGAGASLPCKMPNARKMRCVSCPPSRTARARSLESSTRCPSISSVSHQPVSEACCATAASQRARSAAR